MLQQSYASQLSETKNITILSLLEPIPQRFEHVKVKNQLKRPRTVVYTVKKTEMFSFISPKRLEITLKILMVLKSE